MLEDRCGFSQRAHSLGVNLAQEVKGQGTTQGTMKYQEGTYNPSWGGSKKASWKGHICTKFWRIRNEPDKEGREKMMKAIITSIITIPYVFIYLLQFTKCCDINCLI